MSYFVHNGPCPRCRSKGEDKQGDNLATYSDNHSHCFKCGYTTKGDSVLEFKNRKEKDDTVDTFICADTCDFSTETLKYLKSFGLTDKEIYDNFKGHEDGYVYQDSNFYTIRRLHKIPKVYSKGNITGNEPVFLSTTDRSLATTVIICEDLISAIKISRVCNSCSLLKTQICDKLLWRLANYFDRCYLWLDPDMYNHMAYKLLPLVKPYFKEIKIIMSDRDPKYYEVNKIKEFIYEP